MQEHRCFFCIGLNARSAQGDEGGKANACLLVLHISIAGLGGAGLSAWLKLPLGFSSTNGGRLSQLPALRVVWGWCSVLAGDSPPDALRLGCMVQCGRCRALGGIPEFQVLNCSSQIRVNCLLSPPILLTNCCRRACFPGSGSRQGSCCCGQALLQEDGSKTNQACVLLSRLKEKTECVS